MSIRSQHNNVRNVNGVFSKQYAIREADANVDLNLKMCNGRLKPIQK